MKNWTISDQYFQRFPYQKKDVCICTVFSLTAQLQISFVLHILRQPVDMSLIELKISHCFQYFEGFSYIFLLKPAVIAQ